MSTVQVVAAPLPRGWPVPVAARRNAHSQEEGRTARLPSRPVRELGWLIAGLPLWWLLGIEQAVWPLGTLVAARPLLVGGRVPIVWTRTSRWLAAFLVAFWASAFAVDEPLRWITFLRTFATYTTALLIVLIVTAYARRWRDVDYLVGAVAVAVGISACAGLLAVAGMLRFEFATPVGTLLPDSLQRTGYGQQIAFRSLGAAGWFTGVGTYYRLNGVSLYTNQYATLLGVTLPLLVWGTVGAARRSRRIAFGVAVAAGSVNLVLTTSRVAILGAVLAGVVALVTWAPRWRLHRRRAAALLATLLAVAAVAVVVAGTPRDTTSAGRVLASVQMARGPGSAAGRSAVYQATIEGWLQRPLLGWGTERDVPGVPYPAGSHSHYLGVLYAQGTVGLLLYAGALAAVWRATAPDRHRASDGPAASLLRAGRWSLLFAALDAATNNASLDATSMALVWLTFGLLLAAARQQTEQRREGTAPWQA